MKKMLLPMIALVVGISLSAFTHHQKKAFTNEAWFQFNGGNPSDQDSYSYLGSNDPGCSDNAALCAVRAEIDASTIVGSDITTSKPVESGTGVKSLQVLSTQSSEFSQPSTDVEMHD